MKGMRLALVTRRFWPLVGGAEMVMSNLATEFRRRGAVPIILTAQWRSDWPTEVVHREVPVRRLPNPARRGWGTLRYMASLGGWLRGHRHELDLVCVSMLKHDAYTALGALREAPIPVVLRAEGAGASGDCRWQQIGRFGGRIRRRCRQADALIAPSRVIRDELLEADYPPERVHYIPNGVPLIGPRNPRNRHAARCALGEANHDLAVHDATPVVVYTGRLDEAKGLYELVAAWPRVLEQLPDARLWLVGEGPLRVPLYQRMVDLGVHHQVHLPGAFDQVDDLLLAADLFVLPSHEEGMSLSLLEALGAGLPVVCSDIPGNRQLVDDGVEGRLVAAGEVEPLAQAILDALRNPQMATAWAQAAAARVRRDYSVERMADDHLRLFERLIELKTHP